MAHPSQIEFCLSVKARFPEMFVGALVLDIGSLDINGNNRGLFQKCLYIGVDVAPGRNVDIVTPAHRLTLPDETFDVVVSTECLEHDQYWRDTLRNALRMLRPGGLFLFSCATTGRAEHGTTRTSPQDAPLLQNLGDWAEYYANLTEQDIRSALDIDAAFGRYAFELNARWHDLYFWGRKAGEHLRRADYSFVSLESEREFVAPIAQGTVEVSSVEARIEKLEATVPWLASREEFAAAVSELRSQAMDFVTSGALSSELAAVADAANRSLRTLNELQEVVSANARAVASLAESTHGEQTKGLTRLLELEAGIGRRVREIEALTVSVGENSAAVLRTCRAELDALRLVLSPRVEEVRSLNLRDVRGLEAAVNDSIADVRRRLDALASATADIDAKVASEWKDSMYSVRRDIDCVRSEFASDILDNAEQVRQLREGMSDILGEVRSQSKNVSKWVDAIDSLWELVAAERWVTVETHSSLSERLRSDVMNRMEALEADLVSRESGRTEAMGPVAASISDLRASLTEGMTAVEARLAREQAELRAFVDTAAQAARAEQERLACTLAEAVDSLRTAGDRASVDQASLLRHVEDRLAAFETRVASAEDTAQRAAQGAQSIARALDRAADAGSSAAWSVERIFEYWGDEFLEAAYAAILGREPDANGRAHYLARLASGRLRADVLEEIASSVEARARGRSVAGIDAFLRSRRRFGLRVRGWFERLIRATLSRTFAELDARTRSFDAALREASRGERALPVGAVTVPGAPVNFDGPLLAHPVYGLVRNGRARVGILATPHTLFVARLFERAFERLDIETFVITEAPAEGFEDVIHIVICPQIFARLPGMYLAFQMEQSVSSRWFNDAYFERLRNSVAIFDYSVVNIEFLKANGVAFAQVYHLPIGYLPDFRPALASVSPVADVVFYGDANNERRRRFLEKLRERVNVLVVSEVFGEELLKTVASARVVVNIHYYERALLETTRVYECLSLHRVIVSETSSDIDEHEVLRDLIDFVPVDDVDAMVDRVCYWVANDGARAERERLIESKLSSRCSEFELHVHRFLLANDVLSFERFWELSGSKFGVRGNKLCLSLPEVLGRTRAFESEGRSEYQIVPGLRHQKGWIGCALSYKWIAKLALRDRLRWIVVAEDDTHFLRDFDERWGVVERALETRVGEWDVFSGLIAVERLGPNVEVARIDRMISTVFNAYSEDVLQRMAAWDPLLRLVETNTIDRYLERCGGMRVLVLVPFLVGHKEDLSSTIWHFGNTQYNPLIAESVRVLKAKFDECRARQRWWRRASSCSVFIGN